MGSRSVSRIVFRLLLIVLLIGAATNAVYVFRMNNDPDETVQPRAAAKRPPMSTSTQASTDTKKAAADKGQVRPSRIIDRPSYPTDSWYGMVVPRKDDAGYRLDIIAADRNKPLVLTSYAAWISKRGETAESELNVEKDEKGGLSARLPEGDARDWNVRVRFSSGNSMMEFTQRVTLP